MKSITIIGGGATGTLLAVFLIKNAGRKPLAVNLIEKNSKIGRGVAYSTTNDAHLLNVPAAKMGAFPDDVEDFHRWLAAGGYQYAPHDFVPRRIYGEYLRALFSATVENADENVAVNLYDDEAIDVTLENERAETKLASGASVFSDQIILTFGNFLPPHLRTASDHYVRAAKYFQNPWSQTLVEDLDSNDDVLIIGSGLTMVDTVLTLSSRHHRGKIQAISTHGWLPTVHKLGFAYPSFADELENETRIYEIFKIVRRHIERAAAQNSNWRAVIDGLRPATQKIWLKLADEEKRRFMRHLRRIWDISRHRMPEQCLDILNEMRESGKLELLKGRIERIEPIGENGFEVFYRSKNSVENIKVDAVINCTGSESNFNKINLPLVANLLAKNYIKTDSLNLGLESAPDGKISDRLYTIGTALKGVLWESTAMPELRAQADGLARRLLESA